MFARIIQINKKWSDKCREKRPAFYSDKIDFATCIEETVKRNIKPGYSILEAGGIDRPFWHKDIDIVYDGLDIEYKDRCKEIYDHFFVQSVESPISGKYDLIISKTLLEHVPDNRKTFISFYQALVNEGRTINYQPSKYHLYSLILRFVGNKGQRFLIRKLRPWSADITGYPTHFSYCSPKQMKKLLIDIGFSSVEIRCFYHANDYFAFCFPLFWMVTLWEKFCERFKMESLCAGFIVVAQK